MITKDELIKAWATIFLFCKEQECCPGCPLVSVCVTRLGTKPLDECAAEYIRCV